MKYSRIIIILILVTAFKAVSAQEITLSRKNITLAKLFDEIKKQVAYDFLYNPHILEKAKTVNVEAVKMPLRTVLDNCFVGQPLTYTIDQRTIIIKEKVQNQSGYSVISGRVTDKDNKPVSNVNVFLNNATVGGSTDVEGNFSLINARPGKYELVVSIVGFNTFRQNISVTDENILLPDIVLEPKTIGLQEVVIKPHNDKSHTANLFIFKTQFLGYTYLADYCKILNPEVLDFDYDNATGTLYASTDNRFLVIDNNALGYRMRYLLEDFTCSRSVVKYNGSVLFEPMHGTPSQQSHWAKKREQVYASSEMHFMRALHTGVAEDQGFRVLPYLEDTIKHQKVLSHTPMSCAALLHPTDQDGLYAFGTKYKALYVEYNPKRRFHENAVMSRLVDRTNSESSVITFEAPYLYFDENGWVTNPNDVSLLGAWENYRVTGMLPSDYEPQQPVAGSENAVVPDTSGLGRQLMSIKRASDTLNAKYAAEKLYIQFDKPYYATGDSIWLKAYLFNEPTYNLSDRSGLLHIDIANDSNKVIKQYLLPVREGLAWGNIALDDKVFKPGNYVLRAYTQWMLNFGNDALYYKHFTIAGTGTWLVNENISKGKAGVNAQLQFMGMDKTPIANKQLQLQVKNNGKNLYKQDVSTDANGLLNTTFSLPGKASNVTLIAEDKQGGRKAVIPISVDREKNIDLQFMPEGGSMVAGFSTRVGFKAVGEDGKGIHVSGIVTDQNQKQVAMFKGMHNGIGSFEFVPERDARYTAKVTLSDGTVNTYPLPPVKASGTVMQVKNIGADSLEVDIAASDSLVRAGNSYFLVAKARGVICYAAVADLRRSKSIHSHLGKDLFPSGITHFMLTTVQGQPMNERLVYINHHDDLRFDIQPVQPLYNPKDSVAMHIKVRDKEGQPVLGNFSLAVTDDMQVKTDSPANDNILSHMLLTSDLKGYVEEPGYYATDSDTSRDALDKLLLTQGWVNYDPPAGKLAYQAETEFTVQGRVNNVFNKGLKKTELVLLSIRPQMVMDTLTDKDGRFVFGHFPRIDTPLFVLKTTNRNFNVNIDVDETPSPVFAPPASPAAVPWYVNMDTTLMHYTKSNAQMQQLQYYPGGGKVLKEVKITAKKVVKGSYNLNGPGQADLVLDEKDLEQAGKKNVLQLFYEKIKGFRERGYYRTTHKLVSPGGKNGLLMDMPVRSYEEAYFVNFKRARIFFDGIQIDSALKTAKLIDLQRFLESRDAEDIKGIEMSYSAKYSAIYDRISDPTKLPPDGEEYVYIEVTTRAGHSVFDRKTPGTYLYKPLAISWPKEFYKPKYAVKDTANLTDLRSTIDWEPNVSTDKNGEATVWFYAAGTPSSYSVIIEGVDGNGLLGYKRQKILIAKPKSAVGK